MLADGEQMPVVAGDQTSTSASIAQARIRSSSGSPVTASGETLGAGTSSAARSTRSSSTGTPAFRLEAELPGENSLQLYHRRQEQDEFQSAIDRLLGRSAQASASAAPGRRSGCRPAGSRSRSPARPAPSSAGTVRGHGLLLSCERGPGVPLIARSESDQKGISSSTSLTWAAAMESMRRARSST